MKCRGQLRDACTGLPPLPQRHKQRYRVEDPTGHAVVQYRERERLGGMGARQRLELHRRLALKLRHRPHAEHRGRRVKQTPH